MFWCQRIISKYLELKGNFNFKVNGQEGFSLLEALIAVVLVGFGLLAYGASSGVTIETNSRSEKKSVGVTLAQDKMEFIKDIASTTSLTAANSLTNPGYSGGVWSGGSAEDLDAEGNSGGAKTHYTRTWTINQATAAFLYDATVTVTWGTKSNDTVTLATRIAR